MSASVSGAELPEPKPFNPDWCEFCDLWGPNAAKRATDEGDPERARTCETLFARHRAVMHGVRS